MEGLTFCLIPKMPTPKVSWILKKKKITEYTLILFVPYLLKASQIFVGNILVWWDPG